MFEGFVNACRNANLDCAKYEMETKIGDRTNWILPAIWPRVKSFVTKAVIKPTHAIASLVIGCEAKEPAPMPEVPEAIAKTPLGDDLKKAYEQKCDSVKASAESTHALMNLNITKYREQQAVERHNAALNNVSLPEDAPSRAGSVAGGAALGGLIANIPPEIKKAATDKIVAAIS